jgi:hypothetical protein
MGARGARTRAVLNAESRGRQFFALLHPGAQQPRHVVVQQRRKRWTQAQARSGPSDHNLPSTKIRKKPKRRRCHVCRLERPALLRLLEECHPTGTTTHRHLPRRGAAASAWQSPCPSPPQCPRPPASCGATASSAFCSAWGSCSCTWRKPRPCSSGPCWSLPAQQQRHLRRKIFLLRRLRGHHRTRDTKRLRQETPKSK